MKKTTSLLTLSVACAAFLSACGPEGELPQEAASENTELASGNQEAPEGAQLGTGRSKLAVTNITSSLEVHGGWGGGWGSMGCMSGYVAVGITGRSGLHVDQLSLICAYLNTDGSLGPQYTTSGFGGSGGSFFWSQCPAGQAVVGFHGGAGQYLDRLGVHCASVNSWRTATAVQYSTVAAGGSGGGSFSEIAPLSYVVTSLNLRGGLFVDQFQGVASLIAQ
ncbi:jacalin-like lectin [Stigmatella erecta]|uniref:Jacalin-like lectin domain-containing protein n=1 Tax=Stigmatella erecta TaxID=83460 RepID=A0A1I0HNS7_9BACT|nr:jacalin-like lectin [Stigmatella erecta]SET85404.1 Jacalin-like lectin domain-containing protein [Stigmatella erecta]